MALTDLGVRIATRAPVVAAVQRWVRKAAISQGRSDRASTALTFDDGPHPVWTPRILDALDRIGAKATFFVVGKCVARHPELVRDARRRGHEIGTHLYSHERRTVFDDRFFDEEITKSRLELESLLGERVRWLRFPYGERGRQNPTSIKSKYALEAVHWTFSAHDGKLADPNDVLSRIRAGIRAGAIVLLHDALVDEGNLRPPYTASREVTVTALPRIGELLRARGLAAVTLSELI